MVREWEKLTRYGSPLAKDANANLAVARAAIANAERNEAVGPTRCRQPNADRDDMEGEGEGIDEIENLKTRVAVMTGELNRRQSAHTAVMDLLNAMLEAHYDQPVGAWFGAIRGHVYKATEDVGSDTMPATKREQG